MEPLTVTVQQAIKITGLGNTKLYELMGNGTLETVHVGRRRLILYQSLKKLVLLPETETASRRFRPSERTKHGR